MASSVDTAPRVVSGEMGFFSLAFLVPVFIFLQFLMVPLLTLIDDTGLLTVSFLDRYETPHAFLGQSYLALGAIGAFLLGTYSFNPRPQKLPFRVDWDLKRAVVAAQLVYWGNIAYRCGNYFLGTGTFPEEHYNNLIGPLWVGVIFFPSPYQILAVLVSVVAYLSGDPQERKQLRIHAIILVIAILMSGGITRSRTASFAPLLSLCFVAVFLGSKAVRRGVLATVVVALPAVAVIKYLLRTTETDSLLQTALGEVFHRIAMNNVLIQVVDYFKEPVWGASFVVMFLNSFLPPSVLAYLGTDVDQLYVGGNEFGRAFGLAAPEDYSTGVAIPLVADAYLNFFLPGVLIVFFLYGILARRVQQRVSRQPSCSNVFVFAGLLPLAVNGMEHQFGIILANLVRFLLLYALVSSYIRFPKYAKHLVKGGGTGTTRSILPPTPTRVPIPWRRLASTVGMKAPAHSSRESREIR